MGADVHPGFLPRLACARKPPGPERLQEIARREAELDKQLAAVQERIEGERAVAACVQQEADAQRKVLAGIIRENMDKAEFEERLAAVLKLQAFWRHRASQGPTRRQETGLDMLQAAVERMKLAAHLATLTHMTHQLLFTPEHKVRMGERLGAWWKGTATRRVCFVLFTHHEVVVQRTELWRAALTLQSGWRGYLARVVADRLRRAHRRQALDEARAHGQLCAASAVLLQSAVRGYVGRKNADRRRSYMVALGARKENGLWVVPEHLRKNYKRPEVEVEEADRPKRFASQRRETTRRIQPGGRAAPHFDLGRTAWRLGTSGRPPRAEPRGVEERTSRSRRGKEAEKEGAPKRRSLQLEKEKRKRPSQAKGRRREEDCPETKRSALVDAQLGRGSRRVRVCPGEALDGDAMREAVEMAQGLFTPLKRVVRVALLPPRAEDPSALFAPVDPARLALPVAPVGVVVRRPDVLG